MKKEAMFKFLTSFLLTNVLLISSVSAKESFPSFGNVPWGADEQTVSKYMINDNLVYNVTDNDGDLHFLGSMYDNKIEVIEILDSKNHTLVKSYVTIFNNPEMAKDIYEKIDNDLTESYGKPCEVVDTWTSYWATAYQNSFFGSSISLKINKNGMVHLSFESSKWKEEAKYRQTHRNML